MLASDRVIGGGEHTAFGFDALLVLTDDLLILTMRGNEYTGFTEKVAGKSEISMKVLLPALDLLEVDYLTFITNAMRRVPRPED